MNIDKQADCQAILLIEKEYIDSMLDIDQFDNSSPVVHHESINHSEAYKESNIECRVFNIAGLNIALPASSIRETVNQQAILPGNGEDSQATMCAGTIAFNNEVIDVIDIEYLVMNKRQQHKLADIVLIKGCSTGFIYETSLDSQTIPSTQVHWRDANSKRVWLAGTVAQMGLALLDIEGLVKLSQDRC